MENSCLIWIAKLEIITQISNQVRVVCMRRSHHLKHKDKGRLISLGIISKSKHSHTHHRIRSQRTDSCRRREHVQHEENNAGWDDVERTTGCSRSPREDESVESQRRECTVECTSQANLYELISIHVQTEVGKRNLITFLLKWFKTDGVFEVIETKTTHFYN